MVHRQSAARRSSGETLLEIGVRHQMTPLAFASGGVGLGIGGISQMLEKSTGVEHHEHYSILPGGEHRRAERLPARFHRKGF